MRPQLLDQGLRCLLGAGAGAATVPPQLMSLRPVPLCELALRHILTLAHSGHGPTSSAGAGGAAHPNLACLRLADHVCNSMSTDLLTQTDAYQLIKAYAEPDYIAAWRAANLADLIQSPTIISDLAELAGMALAHNLVMEKLQVFGAMVCRLCNTHCGANVQGAPSVEVVGTQQGMRLVHQALQQLAAAQPSLSPPHVPKWLAQARGQGHMGLLASCPALARMACAHPACPQLSSGAAQHGDAPQPQPGLRRCAGCGVLRYCSEACQLHHWPRHRAQCLAFKAGGGDGSIGTSTSTTTAI